MDFSIFNILSDGEYKLKIFPVYVRGKKIFYKFTCKKGQNTHSRLFYVKEGCLHFEMKNGEKFTAVQNDIIYVPDDIEYYSYWENFDEVDYIGIEFKLTDLCDAPLLLSDSICLFARDERQFYYDRFLQLFKLTEKHEIGSELKCISVFFDILYYRFKEYINSRGEGDNGIFLGKEYLEKYYMTDITIGEISKMCGINETVFRRKFNAYFGMSPLKYKNYLRLNKAVELMREGNNISETAEMLGFCDIYYFSRLFKCYYGVSPKNYIKSNLGGGV